MRMKGVVFDRGDKRRVLRKHRTLLKIADKLAGEYAEMQCALIWQHGEKVADHVNAGHVAGEDEEEHEGHKKGIIHHFQWRPIGGE